jgi:MFS family permease
MPNKLRPWALGVSQAMASAFVVLGTFLAAAFVRDNTGGAGGWRWAYFFNGIIYAVTALSITATYFPPRPVLGRHHVMKEILSSVDYIGILTMSGSFASLIIGLTWGGRSLRGIHCQRRDSRPSLIPDDELPNPAVCVYN